MWIYYFCGPTGQPSVGSLMWLILAGDRAGREGPGWAHSRVWGRGAGSWLGRAASPRGCHPPGGPTSSFPASGFRAAFRKGEGGSVRALQRQQFHFPFIPLVRATHRASSSQKGRRRLHLGGGAGSHCRGARTQRHDGSYRNSLSVQ